MFLYIILSEEGANKVADVATSVVQDAIVDHMGPDILCQLHDLSIMCAMKSQCKALEHIRTAFWPLCGWNNTFCYIILSEEGARRVDLTPR